MKCKNNTILTENEHKRRDVLFWTSNILSGGCQQIKYWMPIHYDNIKDRAKQKISSFILELKISNVEGFSWRLSILFLKINPICEQLN